MARNVVEAASHPRPTVSMGWVTHAARLGHFLSARLTGQGMNALIGAYRRRAETVEEKQGNLFHAPAIANGVGGGLRARQRWLGAVPVLLAVGAGLGLLALLSARRER